MNGLSHWVVNEATDYSIVSTLETFYFTHTHTHTQPFYGSLDFVWDNPGEPVSEETFDHTPIVVISHPVSASFIYYDPWHPPVQFLCLTIFLHNRSPGFLWCTSRSGTLHNYTPYISSLNHCLLFTAHAHTIAICFVVVSLCHLQCNPSPSLSHLFTWNSIL